MRCCWLPLKWNHLQGVDALFSLSRRYLRTIELGNQHICSSETLFKSGGMILIPNSDFVVIWFLDVNVCYFANLNHGWSSSPRGVHRHHQPGQFIRLENDVFCFYWYCTVLVLYPISWVACGRSRPRFDRIVGSWDLNFSFPFHLPPRYFIFIPGIPLRMWELPRVHHDINLVFGPSTRAGKASSITISKILGMVGHTLFYARNLGCSTLQLFSIGRNTCGQLLPIVSTSLEYNVGGTAITCRDPSSFVSPWAIVQSIAPKLVVIIGF